MRLSQKYFRIRLVLLLTPFVLVVLAFFIFTLVSNYFVSQEALNVASFTIDKKYFGSFDERPFLKTKKKNYTCYDITVREQPTIIRLSESTHRDKWYEIHDNYAKGDNLVVLYADHLLKDDILHNPHELRINNNIIISLDDNKKLSKHTYIIIAVMAMLFLFYAYLAYKTYLIEYLEEDKRLYRENKWALIKRWLNE